MSLKYADKDGLEYLVEKIKTLLTGKQDVIPANTYDTYGAASSVQTTVTRTLYATFTVSGWTTNSDGTFSQIATCIGMAAADNPLLVKDDTTTRTAAQQAAYNKDYACFTDALSTTTAADSVTFVVLKKPSADIKIGFKGV